MLRSHGESFLPNLLILAACAISGFGLTPGSLAALSIPVNPQDLRDASPVIVDAEVEAVRSGLDPTRGRLATYITLRVRESLRGATDFDRIVIREPGGRMGDLVHEVDAVPRYEPGQRVVVFLQPAHDGALRTTAMFLGKFDIDGSAGAETARRAMDGSGWIDRRTRNSETQSLAQLRAVILDPQAPAPRFGVTPASRKLHMRYRKSSSDRSPVWRATPPELARIVWQAPEDESSATRIDVPPTGAQILDERPADPDGGAEGRFAPLSETYPTRWTEPDWGQSLGFSLERARSPIANIQVALDAIQAGFQAWTDVPESRLEPILADDDANYTGTNSQSPAAVYNGTRTILFGDPYDDIADPVGCGGVLAIGGYWRGGTVGSSINGRSFYTALQGYVIFNNNFECFLGNAENLAEVATHELGHALGFGHSSQSDSIMRSTAYGGRGARLGDDDFDAAHCHYPHQIDISDPDAGQVWLSGVRRNIRWNSSFESGPDSGDLVLEYSLDAGATWSLVDAAVKNNGSLEWQPPQTESSGFQVRIRRPVRVDGQNPDYPTDCTTNASDGLSTLTQPVTMAGSIDSAGPRSGLRISPSGGSITLDWDASCSGLEETYAVYAGDLTLLRQGFWNHTPLSCDTSGTRSLTDGIGGPNRYYLIVPVAAGHEGGAGTNASGAPRPTSGLACLPREATTSCEEG